MNSIDLSILSHGGPVMWLLLAVSIVGLVIFVERTLFLHRGQIRSTAFLDGIKNILVKRRLMEAVTVCEETPGPAAAIVKAALLHHDAGEQKLRLAVQEAALTEMPILERRVSALAAIAQAAPLIGLLGTVLGMMATFQAFGEGGNYAAPGALAGGMWQALLTTVGGLAIGVLAHLAHHFLKGRVRALVRDMEWVANEIMRYLLIEMPAVSKEGADDGHPAA
jgi:biopolymer transport protein ExbB